MSRPSPIVQVFSGVAFTPLDPKAADVRLEDIAHHLSLINRFNGGTNVPYSVAEHCITMSRLVDPDIALHALLHDAAEAYLGDIVRPIKKSIPELGRIEDHIVGAIYEAFRITIPSNAQVRRIAEADRKMLATEAYQLMPPAFVWTDLLGVQPYKGVPVGVMPWYEAKATYIRRFHDLFTIHRKLTGVVP